MLGENIEETTTTTGTGTVTLSAVSGKQRVSDHFAVGEFVDYRLASGSDFEWGVGRVAASNTFERTIVTLKSVSGTLTSYPSSGLSLSGTSTLICTQNRGTVSPTRGGNTMGTLAPGVLSSAHLVNTAIYGSTVAFPASNKIVWVPFVWPVGCRRYISSLKVYVSATGTATKLRIGILKPLGDTYTSLSLLTQTSDMDVSTTGVKTHTFSSPLAVPDARFMMALLSDGSFTTRAADGVVGDNYNNVYSSTLYHRPLLWNAETDSSWTSITDSMLQRNWMDSGDSANQVQVWVGQ